MSEKLTTSPAAYRRQRDIQPHLGVEKVAIGKDNIEWRIGWYWEYPPGWWRDHRDGENNSKSAEVIVAAGDKKLTDGD